jgi:hypothetical protein
MLEHHAPTWSGFVARNCSRRPRASSSGFAPGPVGETSISLTARGAKPQRFAGGRRGSQSGSPCRGASGTSAARLVHRDQCASRSTLELPWRSHQCVASGAPSRSARLAAALSPCETRSMVSRKIKMRVIRPGDAPPVNGERGNGSVYPDHRDIWGSCERSAAGLPPHDVARLHPQSPRPDTSPGSRRPTHRRNPLISTTLQKRPCDPPAGTPIANSMRPGSRVILLV